MTGVQTCALPIYEVEGSLATLQGEVNGDFIVASGGNNDELALRRKAKGA